MRCIAILLVLAAPGSMWAEEAVFRTDTVLIYRGVYVQPQVIDGKSGYLVEMSQRQILINDVVVFEYPNGPLQMAIVRNPDVRHEDPLEDALRQFWNRASYDSARGEVRLDGATYQPGDTLDYPVHGHDEIARARLLEGLSGKLFMELVIVGREDRPVRVSMLERPAIMTQEEVNEKLQEGFVRMFGSALSMVRSGLIHVCGRRYCHSFPLSEAEAVMASLNDTQERLRAHQDLRSIVAGVEEPGVSPDTLPLQVKSGAYTWSSGVLHDLALRNRARAQ